MKSITLSDSVDSLSIDDEFKNNTANFFGAVTNLSVKTYLM